MECTAAYNAFFESYKAHTDPVYFRATVFCTYLAYFCQDHKVRCNVNEFSSLRLELHIWLKVEYWCSKCHRMLEVMSITHFFFGPHISFINEFPQRLSKYKNGHGTRYKALQDFLNLQKKNNPGLILEDDELRDACTKQDKRDFNDRLRSHE